MVSVLGSVAATERESEVVSVPARQRELKMFWGEVAPWAAMETFDLLEDAHASWIGHIRQ